MSAPKLTDSQDRFLELLFEFPSAHPREHGSRKRALIANLRALGLELPECPHGAFRLTEADRHRVAALHGCTLEQYEYRLAGEALTHAIFAAEHALFAIDRVLESQRVTLDGDLPGALTELADVRDRLELAADFFWRDHKPAELIVAAVAAAKLGAAQRSRTVAAPEGLQ